MQSLRLCATREEYLWQGDAEIWSGRAPILFPVIGGLADDSYTANGKRFQMAKHGFARNREFSLHAETADSVTLSLESDTASMAMYPWKFSLQVEFLLQDQSLLITYKVLNRDQESMYFNIGSHPAFRLPMEGSALRDYKIVFEKPETLKTYRIVDAVMLRDPIPLLRNARSLPLSRSTFDKDALVFMDINSSTISLDHVKEGPRLRLHTGGAPHLGIWAKPAAPYVCIEPWWGYNDFSDGGGDIADKPSIQTLAAGETFQTSIRIELV